MIPVLTAAEMAGVDAAATEPVERLVARAGTAVARAALELLGGAYGRRVVVVAGKGNNGADGRVAASRLAARGAAVRVVAPPGSAPDAPTVVPGADLVIDAAYGTGLRRAYEPPDVGQTPVLAVDIPSGLAGDTGRGRALEAVRTVTFAALKPGLLLGAGPSCSGVVEVADIGVGDLVDGAARAWLVGDEDAARVPRRPRETHKWRSAVAVVAGSPGMTGAAWMSSRAALRAGAGYVRLAVPGTDPAHTGLPPGELVGLALPAEGWDEPAASGLDRFGALVVGPGLGRQPGGEVARLLSRAPLPAVVDADGLNALGDLRTLADVVAARAHPLVVTPHDGEYARLTGTPPGEDRVAAVRETAARSGAVVLLKGSTTLVAAPDGRVLFVTAGSPRLATAGTGDVLSGVIGALLAQGVPAFEAAGIGAHVHGRAAAGGRAVGLIVSDLPELVADWLSEHAG